MIVGKEEEVFEDAGWPVSKMYAKRSALNTRNVDCLLNIQSLASSCIYGVHHTFEVAPGCSSSLVKLTCSPSWTLRLLRHHTASKLASSAGHGNAYSVQSEAS